ncbi:hypothetical protein AYI68_g1083 [Smittium mucronatum]|uniref:Ran guanine nucleotide release factor n=1 Tax=Smittium mucronatum TaxID=133383 RepID=A0A1R0H6K0_9FUNG|nr:hypothetical protein AYI68_g1083 [Smittium mucronatum]
MNESLQERPLFGGAISVQFPINNFVDVRFHYNELGNDNESAGIEIITETQLPNIAGINRPHSAYCLYGLQKASKFNEKDNLVQVSIFVILIRLFDVKTDFLVTLNCPNLSGPPEAKLEAIAQMASTFKIRDWDLFD